MSILIIAEHDNNELKGDTTKTPVAAGVAMVEILIFW